MGSCFLFSLLLSSFLQLFQILCCTLHVPLQAYSAVVPSCATCWQRLPPPSTTPTSVRHHWCRHCGKPWRCFAGGSTSSTTVMASPQR
ncbi:hypothetical protein GLYMA_02G189850v4 [Glycine max]|nr:hypothetical protein GLYMA_02G189850v4 [Glycine max]KAH1061051.1 hypothetical protein GYH30_004515 [Glycine max]